MDDKEKADKVLIQWPSGITQTIKDVNANQFITITEGRVLTKGDENPPPLMPPSYLPPHGGEKLGRELIVALPRGEGRRKGLLRIPPPLTGGGGGGGEKGGGGKVFSREKTILLALSDT